MTPPNDIDDANAPPAVAHLELKAMLMLALVVTLIIGSVTYILYARGAFERTQTLVLVADDAQGVTVGLDLTFSGFPIGRVRQVELADDGKARIVIAVASKDARWLRTSSIFTMERGLVGDTKLRAYSGILTDAPLPDGAERAVLVGDVAAEIPRVVGVVRTLVENLERMTASESSLNASLGNVQALTDGFKGRYGALGAVMGGDANAKQIVTTLERANALLAKTDQRVFGPQGLMDDTQATVKQLNGVLTDVRASLQQVNTVLAEAQKIASNTSAATADLGALRVQVETSLRRVDGLVLEINRKWPFARDAEVKLP
jgi:phospholipid/cholesterol/gamma-HCH transport system substrate-binding protein